MRFKYLRAAPKGMQCRRPNYLKNLKIDNFSIRALLCGGVDMLPHGNHLAAA